MPDRSAVIAMRRGSRTDAEPAAELWLRAREAARGAIPPPAHSAVEVRAWFAAHVVQDTELWLAHLEDGSLGGLLVLDGDWLEQLYVDPAHTGEGIGAGLLAVAKRERPAGLRLWTFVSNSDALRFYERHGFTEVRRTDGRDNEEGAPDVLLEWAG